MNKYRCRHPSVNVTMEAVLITAADFNGRTFDGSPFKYEGELPQWLHKAVSVGVVRIHPDDRDYAMWDVFGLETFAPTTFGPGDWICKVNDIVFGISGKFFIQWCEVIISGVK